MENFESIGYQLPLIIFLIVWIVLVGLAVAFLKIGHRRPDGWDSGWSWAGAGIGSLGVLALLGWVGALIPFDGKYHHIYRVTGEVTSVSNVLSESGGDLTRTPVLTIEGLDRDVTVDDPRAVNLGGKTVDFTCSIGWHYQGADTYNCRIYNINQEAAK